MTEPSAKVILDSISPAGHRVTTIEVVMHRFVLAEFNTHRVFSRNSASSRAIPLRKQIERISTDPADPLVFPKEQPGMQGGEEVDDPARAEEVWASAREAALDHANRLRSLGVHKSVANRLLEPFMWHTVIVTSTMWEDFFRLRCSPLSQPEIAAAAEAMRTAYRASDPTLTRNDQWHMPYLSAEERGLAVEADHRLSAQLRLISAARCARVSYLTHDGTCDPGKDLALARRLATAEPPHASPFEHVCRPMGSRDKQMGNLEGWHQLRHSMFDDAGPDLTIEDILEITELGSVTTHKASLV